ncbi:CcmD family protein [Cytophagaceae bacterium ABcell3]|nr:CcmD family protein [Cytophagaceae bacterium ABcell3]
MKKLLYIIMMFMLSFTAFGQHPGAGAPGQSSSHVEMADTFREDGKIFVVVAVMLLIFLGIALYLFILDRRISKVEKNVDNPEYV